MTAGSDSLTVLHAPGRRLAKLLCPDGRVEGYDRTRTLDAYTVPVADLSAILALLQRLLVRPECCVMRGELLVGERAAGIRRLLHADKASGDQPTFRNVPRRWLALDMEGVTLPAHQPAYDLAGCGRLALAMLPAPFHGAACIVQASASHGLRADLRLRLWVWLSRPTWDHELRRWTRGSPADPSVFGAVQPIYTAAPVLAPGMRDPLPARLLAVPGSSEVLVPSPETLAPERREATHAASAAVTPAGGTAYVRSAMVRAAHRISTARHPGRHSAIVGETARLARFVAPGWLSEASIADVVREAAREAGKDDRTEVDAAIAWGLANPWTNGPMPDTRNGR